MKIIIDGKSCLEERFVEIDAKIAGIFAIEWDEKEQEVVCVNTSYVAEIEYAEVLDFYHASEHLSDVCKALYGEQTQSFKQHYDKWLGLIYAGETDTVLSELKQLRDTCEKVSLRDELQGEIQ
ncbi:hypothetical protein ES705_40000 [subsurface metagenome]